MKTLIFVAIVFILAGCTEEEILEDDSSTTNSAVPEIASEVVYQEDIGDYVLEPDALTVDEEGNVYLTAPDQYAIMKFDNEGRFIAQAGEHGEGPGEFSYTPRSIGYSEDLIYVAGTPMQVRQMTIFNSEDLNFQKQVNIPEGKGAVQFTLWNKDLLIPFVKVAMNEDGEGTHILHEFNTYDVDTEEATFFAELKLQKETDQIWKNLGHPRADDDLIAFTYRARPYVEAFDTSEEEIEHTVIDLPIEEEPEIGMVGEDDGPGVEAPLTALTGGTGVANDHIFVQGGNVSDSLQKTIFVFDRTGDLQGEIQLDALGSALHVKENHVYYVTEDAELTKIRYDVDALDDA